MLFKIAITQKQTLTGENKELNVETNKINFGASIAAAFFFRKCSFTNEIKTLQSVKFSCFSHKPVKVNSVKLSRRTRC